MWPLCKGVIRRNLLCVMLCQFLCPSAEHVHEPHGCSYTRNKSMVHGTFEMHHGQNATNQLNSHFRIALSFLLVYLEDLKLLFGYCVCFAIFPAHLVSTFQKLIQLWNFLNYHVLQSYWITLTARMIVFWCHQTLYFLLKSFWKWQRRYSLVQVLL